MIDWITENYKEVFAFIGVLYTAARFIVSWTPANVDDEYLDKAGEVIKKIANILGLDFYQGRYRPPNKIEDPEVPRKK